MSLISRSLGQFCNFTCKSALNLPKNRSLSTTKYLKNGYQSNFAVCTPKTAILQRQQIPLVYTGMANCHRHYSSDVDDSRPKRSLPTLMEFPEVLWPSMLKTIRNWIMVTFIIRPYFDQEFSMQDFVRGTKHALQIVSTSLASGDVKNLAGLVDPQAVGVLKAAISRLSMAQRSDLQVNKEDVYLSFPYQVGVMFDESDENVQKRYVEITMVFHVLKGLKERLERGEGVPLNMSVNPEFKDKVSICNYRFIKEFTKGCESDWTINMVNHFKPSDFTDDD